MKLITDMIPLMKCVMTFQEIEDIYTQLSPLPPNSKIIGTFAKNIGYKKQRVMKDGRRSSVYIRMWRKPPF